MALLESLKLPDILKASAAQAFALAVACVAFIYLSKSGFLPPFEPSIFLLTAFVGIFAGSLWVVLAIRGLWKQMGLRNSLEEEATRPGASEGGDRLYTSHERR